MDFPSHPAPPPAIQVQFSDVAAPLDTPVWRICADPRGKAVLDRDLPGLTLHPAFSVFKAMTLRQLAALSGGRLPQAALDKVQADLTRLAESAQSAQVLSRG